MSSSVSRAVRYWFKATLHPGQVIAKFQSDPHKVLVSLWIAFLFGVLYSVTAYLLWVYHHLPVIPPWVPIEAERYYLYQTLWTIPWGLGTLIMMSGLSHLLAIAGKKNPSKYQFEDALSVCTIGWVIPSFYCMWMPETFLAPFFGVFWPFWVDILRLMIFPTIWQVFLVALGLRITHEVGWPKGVGIGIATVLISFVMFMVFMR